MATVQPLWRRVANLGDVHPIDHGGYFVYTDRSKVYPPEGEYLESPDTDTAPEGWILYRFILERCTYTPYDPTTGARPVLSDNKYHPDLNAWFGFRAADRPQDSCITDVARSHGIPIEELIGFLCHEDPIARAEGYRMIGFHHGFQNLDGYPSTYHKRSQLPRRIRRYKGRY